MDPRPNNNEAGAFKLPEVQGAIPVQQPELNPVDYGAVPEKLMSQQAESGAGQLSTHNPMPVPVSPIPLNNMPTQPIIPAPTANAAIAGQPTNLPARDTDLIEKEWVVKAKAIVEKTKDDPFEQKEEVNKMKAEYIKKRYNKDIKIN